MDISFSYRSPYASLPDVQTQLSLLWQVALFLDDIGIPLEQWCPTADTPEDALLNQAFDRNGPSAALIALTRENKRLSGDFPMDVTAVWNGIRGAGSVGISHILFPGAASAASVFKISSSAAAPLLDKENLVQIASRLLTLFPAPFISISHSRYNALHKVFKERPGAGWMLFLPRQITPADVPAAQELRPLLDAQGTQRGTFVISTRDEAFDVTNDAHLSRAAAIEMQLVDKDLLPRFDQL
ncbi:hypothetical protein RC52_16160 [Herbaspirillum rubrisubalbicans]|nr:Imm52 family immunity protein [Herbaspirillum rubrisubalbicans]NQE49999.1 hypothetical protein [Herbaspirillum rubrisubalbicans]